MKTVPFYTLAALSALHTPGKSYLLPEASSGFSPTSLSRLWMNAHLFAHSSFWAWSSAPPWHDAQDRWAPDLMELGLMGHTEVTNLLVFSQVFQDAVGHRDRIKHAWHSWGDIPMRDKGEGEKSLHSLQNWHLGGEQEKADWAGGIQAAAQLWGHFSQADAEPWSQHSSSGNPVSDRNAGTRAVLCSVTSWEQPRGHVASSHHSDGTIGPLGSPMTC